MKTVDGMGLVSPQSQSSSVSVGGHFQEVLQMENLSEPLGN